MTGAVLQPQGEKAYARDLRTARAGLSEEAFKGAWADGRSLSPEQSIEEALIETQRPLRVAGWPAVIARRGAGSLTERELEVTGLIARGLSNRQIAEQLVISQRTADRHVSNILDKLGFAGRGQIAAWVFGHKDDGVLRLTRQ
jgi:DNA-binding NarL/FixJ family response regulator